MNETNDSQTVTFELGQDEALILFEWLSRMEDPDDLNDLSPFEQAALGMRWNVESLLEKELHEPFAPDYDDQLEAAIESVPDEWYTIN